MGLQHDYGNKGETPLEDNYDDDNIPEIDLPQSSEKDGNRNLNTFLNYNRDKKT